MKKIKIPNPEDYPASRSAPWPKEDNDERNCFTYAMNSNYYPGTMIGEIGTYYLKGDLKKIFAKNLPEEWSKLVEMPTAPEGLSEKSKAFFDRDVMYAVQDGLIPVNAAVSCDGFRLIAMVFCLDEKNTEAYDYHWLRLDNDGRWSEKNGFGFLPGKGRIGLVKDDAGKCILNPKEHFNQVAPDKDIFATYFLVPKSDEDLGKLPYKQKPIALKL